MSKTFDANKNLPQIKNLSEFQLRRYKKLCDDLDKSTSKLNKANVAYQVALKNHREIVMKFDSVFRFNFNKEKGSK